MLVTLEPSTERIAAMGAGASYTRFRLPVAAVQRTGDRFVVRIDPDAIPDRYVTAAGLVTMRVEATDPAARTGTMLVATVRRVTLDGDGVWAPVDVTAAALDQRAGRRTAAARRSVTARAPQLRPAAVRQAFGGTDARRSLAAHVPHLAATMRRVPNLRPARLSARASGPDAAEARAAAYGSGDCSIGGGRRIREATIGTSYPMLRRSRSWLTYASSSSSGFGVATNIGNGWFQSSGTKSLQDSWGGRFYPGKRIRSYRVGVVYRQEVCRSYKYGTIRSRAWVPVKQTGGIRANLLNQHRRPKWRARCAGVRVPEWWRGRASGKAYSLSYGVKFRDVVGFNLRSRRGYSSSSRLYYTNPGRRALCGSNDWPARASKLMERYWKARTDR